MREIVAKEKLLVNAVTLLRLPFTGVGVISLYQYGCSGDSLWVTFFVAISICIYLSDFIDGRMARQWGVCSDNGARLDLFCDSFYIFSCLLTMILIEVSSPWILSIVLYKLLEFIVTSRIKRKFSNGETFYCYDKIGRALSGLFYITPAVLLILHANVPLYWEDVLEGYTVMLAGLTVISSWAKLENMKKSFS